MPQWALLAERLTQPIPGHRKRSGAEQVVGSEVEVDGCDADGRSVIGVGFVESLTSGDVVVADESVEVEEVKGGGRVVEVDSSVDPGIEDKAVELESVKAVTTGGGKLGLSIGEVLVSGIGVGGSVNIVGVVFRSEVVELKTGIGLTFAEGVVGLLTDTALTMGLGTGDFHVDRESSTMSDGVELKMVEEVIGGGKVAVFDTGADVTPGDEDISGVN